MSYERFVSFGLYYTSDRHDYGEEADEIGWSHKLMNGGRISVVDRMTGFGWRDIETGYSSPCGGFWLASGNQDIRDHLADFDSEEGMCQWVIDRATSCNGYRSGWRSATTAAGLGIKEIPA